MSDDLDTVAVPTPFGAVLVGPASNARLAALARHAGGEGAQRLLGIGTATPADPIVLARLRALAGRACLYVPAARDGDRALMEAIARGIAGGLLVAVFVPRAPLGPMVEGARVAPQSAALQSAATQSAGRTPFRAMSATERIAELLRQTPAYLTSDLAEAFKQMVTPEAIAGIAAAFAVLLAAQFVGVGEIADAALAYWAYTQAGLSGLYGLYEALRAVVDAVRAPDEAAFKGAVRRFADGLSLVGIALLTAVVTRAARRRAAGSDTESGGGGGGGGEPAPRTPRGTIKPKGSTPPSGPLGANETYEANGYTFKTDAQGRVTSASGSLRDSPGTRNPAAQRVAGGADRLPTDDGGHLIATRFDGPGDSINLVPQNSNLNRGAWKVMENGWAKALQDGKSVDVSVTPIYEGASTRPTMFEVESQISGEAPVTRYFENKPGG